MAILKANYIKFRGVKRAVLIQKAKATLAYNVHRVGKNKEKMERQIFSWDGEVNKEYALRMIENLPKGAIIRRIVFSPSKPEEWEMTVRAFAEMEDNEVLGFHGNLKPFKLRRMDWTHYPLSMQRS